MINRTNRKMLVLMESRQAFFVSAVIFRVMLDWAYLEFVNPVFAYMGFVLEPTIAKYVESWLAYLALVLMLRATLRRPSDFLMALLVFSSLTPILVFYALADASRSALYTVLLGALLINIFRQGRPLALPLIRFSRPMAIALLLLGAAIVTFWMIYSGGFQFFNLDLSRVYEFRRDAGEIIHQGVMGHFNNWATKVFGPALLALALWWKKYWLAVVVFGLHVFWFGIIAQKSVLFFPFLVFFLWAWFRFSKALSLIPLGMSILIFGSYLLYVVFDETFVGSLFIRRVFFVPARLTFLYYEFFSANDFVYWSNSITSSFIQYPYHISPAALIGDYMGTNSNANNSFLSTGYMHAGIAGVIFYSIVVGLLFRLVDSISFKGIPPWVAIAVMIVPTRSLLISADLPTSLLTHGIGIAVLMLFLLRSRTGVIRGRAKRMSQSSSSHNRLLRKTEHS